MDTVYTIHSGTTINAELHRSYSITKQLVTERVTTS